MKKSIRKNRTMWFKSLIILLCLTTTLEAKFDFLKGYDNPNGMTGQVTIQLETSNFILGTGFHVQQVDFILPMTNYLTFEFNTYKLPIFDAGNYYPIMNHDYKVYIHLPFHLLWD